MRDFMELRHAQTAVLWFLGGTLFLVYVAALLSFSDYLTRVASSARLPGNRSVHGSPTSASDALGSGSPVEVQKL